MENKAVSRKIKLASYGMDDFVGKSSNFCSEKPMEFCDFKVLQSAKMRILESDMTILRNLPGF